MPAPSTKSEGLLLKWVASISLIISLRFKCKTENHKESPVVHHKNQLLELLGKVSEMHFSMYTRESCEICSPTGVSCSSWSCLNLVLCAIWSLHQHSFLSAFIRLLYQYTDTLQLDNLQGEENREPRNKCQTCTLITDAVNQWNSFITFN